MQIFGLPRAMGRVSEPGYAELIDDARERVRHVSCFHALPKKGMSASDASEVIGISNATERLTSFESLTYYWPHSARNGAGRG
jgi:hypothetical protein